MYESTTMKNTRITQLEDLPVEMLIEIFRYLSVHELYVSFSYLNNRLNSILKSLPNLILITTSHCHPILSFFNSFGSVQIYLKDSKSSSLSQYNFSNFYNIQSFIIIRTIHSDSYIEPIEQIDQFITPTLCPHLQSLRIPYCSQILIDRIFTSAFPYLKICHIYDTPYKKVTLPLVTVNSISASLRQLTIQKRTADEFEKILLMCPNLNYLDFSCYCILSPLMSLNSPYLSLKRLRISRLKKFSFHNGQFKTFLSFFPDLKHFNLTVEQCDVENERIDFIQIAKYLKDHLPHLILLDWRIYVTVLNRTLFYRHTFEEIAKLHPLFKCFGRTDGLVHIASYDFTSAYHYDRHFLRASFE